MQKILKTHAQLVAEGAVVRDSEQSDWRAVVGGTYIRDAATGELSLVDAGTALPKPKAAARSAPAQSNQESRAAPAADSRRAPANRPASPTATTSN